MESAPLDDRGLLLGDGLFETLLWTRGGLVLGPEHGARMIGGADALGLSPPSLAGILALAEAAVAEAGLSQERVAVRLTLTAGSGGRGLDRPEPTLTRLFATAAASPKPEGPAALALSTVRRNAGSPASRLKTLAYLDNVLARREARGLGADEAVMLNGDGHVACAAVANLFWVRDGALFTPPTEAGCLEGVMRAQVIAAAERLGVPVRLAVEPPAMLEHADALFLTNSLVGVRPACWIGGGGAATHPLTLRLASAVAPFC